jgi:hypothetical protein
MRQTAFRPFALAIASATVLATILAVPASASGSASRATHHSGASHRLPEAGNANGHAAVPAAGRAVNTRHPDQVIGHGHPGGCTSAAVVRAVAKGGVITFDCGPNPITITMKATAKVWNTRHRIVLDGGNKVTLSGGGTRRILYMNTCDKRRIWTTDHCNDQKWPYLILQNLTFADGNSQVKQTRTSNYGGGAVFELGGRLKVVNTRFIDNRCYRVGPDLGGAAIRALEQFHNRPIYITKDTFRGGRCSNGSGLSSIGVSWIVTDSVFVNNRATGHGANPTTAPAPGGGSGGAIYTDGDHYTVVVNGSVMRNNHANEGGGAIFYVSDNNTGSMTIEHSTLHHNPSEEFWTRPFPGIFYQSAGHPLKVIKSTIN